jgi:hypothetical protein
MKFTRKISKRSIKRREEKTISELDGDIMLKLPEILEQLKVKARKCLSTLFMSLSSIFFINKFWYLPDKRISAKTLLSVSQKNLEGNLVIKYIKNKISKGIGNNVFTFVYGKNNLIFSRNSFFVQKANRA